MKKVVSILLAMTIVCSLYAQPIPQTILPLTRHLLAIPQLQTIRKLIAWLSFNLKTTLIILTISQRLPRSMRMQTELS